MITPEELLEKTEKLFFKVVSASLRGEKIFPYTIPSNKKISGSNYSDWKNDLVPLYEKSKAVRSHSYSVDWKDKIINGSVQSVPARIYFETFEDYLFFTGKRNAFAQIAASRQLLLNQLPQLEEWIDENLPLVWAYTAIWKDVIKVCRYFLENAPPHSFYIRELPIDVHSKFIEDNKTLLKKLLDILLPPDWIQSAESDFTCRYFLKKLNIYAQIRILDETLKPHLGYDECALTLDDVAWLKWTPEKVFIIENKACFLSFPKVPKAVAIWGEGFKSSITRHIPWLRTTQLYCWFDLDAAGFEMLDIMRANYPQVHSFLMDEKTLNEHERFLVENKTRRKELQLLTQAERTLYQTIQQRNIRLEQERIPQRYIQNRL